MTDIEMKYRPKARYWLPNALVDLKCVKNDVIDLYERGFGSIEVVSFMPFGDRDCASEFAWGSKKWLDVIVTILETAQAYQMKVDLANGPAWPIAMPTIKNADNPASLYELTYGKVYVKDLKDNLIPEPRVNHQEGTSQLIACVMYKEIEEGILDETTYIDLMPYIKDKQISYPFSNHSSYIIFTFYEQPACHQVNGYYVIDHLSKEGVNACAKYWLPVYEKYLKPYKGTLQFLFCDSLEYKVSMEWTRGFKEMFLETKQYDLCPYLPVISSSLTYPKNDIPNYCFQSSELTQKVQNDYFEMISDCYVHHHLEPLEHLANQMNMNVRYQVAYNKPFNIEQAAGAVGICEGEALSRASLDNLKSMAGTVHLLGKEKYSYECSAEFGNGYGQTFEDIFWWIKRSYSAGMNDQVFHGASYNGNYKDHLYEPFLKEVSNYWNRVQSKECMAYQLKAYARLNQLLQSQHFVDLAIYRQEYINNGKGGDGSHILKDDLLLTKQGYTYDFVSKHTLCLLKENKPNYKAFIIPKNSYIDKTTQNQIESLHLPIFYMENEDYASLIHLLKKQNIYPDASYQKETIIFSQHFENGYYFYNGHQVQFGYLIKDKPSFDPTTIYPTINKEEVMTTKELEAIIQGDGYPVLYDYRTDQYYRINYLKTKEGYHIHLHFRKDEAIIIQFVDEKEYSSISLQDVIHSKPQKIISKLTPSLINYYQTTLHHQPSFNITYHKVTHDFTAGYMNYFFSLDILKEDNYYLELTEVNDQYKITLDDTTMIGFNEYQPLTHLGKLSIGSHQLKIRVYTTLRPLFFQDQKLGLLKDINLITF